MTRPTFILGGWQSDFAHKAPDGEIHPLITDATLHAIEASQVAAAEIEVVHVGNFVAERFCGQGQLGGIVVSAHPALAGVPAARHEAACASGSMAAMAAMADIESGRYDVALVVGAEVLRNRPGDEAGRLLGCAAWAGREVVDDPFPWPSQFAAMADEYAYRFGLEHAHLGRIAEINRRNALRNPNAQTRDWALSTDDFYEDDSTNPPVVGRLRRQDCSRTTDGAAAIVVASAEFTRKWAKRASIPMASTPFIRGWGHRTDRMLLADKLTASQDSPYLFPHLRGAITDAYRRADIGGPGELDAIETHDCFTISEYVAIDHFGITAPGQAWKAVEEGVIDHDGTIPINPSGGLIGVGHPVGATGVRMLLDAAKQVTGQAGAYQVDSARNVATLNIGGSATTAAAFIVSVQDR